MVGILRRSVFAFPLPVPNRSDARDAAHRELSRAIYATHRPNLLQRLYESLLHWLGRLIGTLVSVTPGGALGLVILLVASVGLVFLLLHRLGPVDRSARIELHAGPAARTALMERRHAEELAARADWPEAIRSRLRAVSRELEETGILDRRPGRTADELAREAGRLVPTLNASIRSATNVFDEVWYGGRPATAAGYQTVVAADEALQRAPAGVPR